MYLYMHIFNITSENISRSLIGFNCEKQKKVNFSVITQKGEREIQRQRDRESAQFLAEKFGGKTPAIHPFEKSQAPADWFGRDWLPGRSGTRLIACTER